MSLAVNIDNPNSNQHIPEITKEEDTKTTSSLLLTEGEDSNLNRGIF